MYQVLGHCDLDLFSRIFVSGEVHISYVILGRNPKFGVWLRLWIVLCRGPFSGHCELDL